MVHPVHIPLEQRKIMAPRLVFFQAAEPLALQAAQAGAGDAFDSFRKLYHISFDAAAQTSLPNEPLDLFLTNTLGSFRENAEFLFRKHLSLFDSIWTAIVQHAGQMACQPCSHLPNQICDSGDHDAEIVHERGHCIQPLRRMFTFAAGVTATYYSTYAKLTPPRPDVVFSTAFCTRVEDLHDFPVPFCVAGVTEFPSRGQVSRVKLRYVPTAFDWDTYAANLYVLFHECLCHAFHAISPSALDRKSLPAFDTFAEGWMDWVALKVLDEVLRGHGPAGHLLGLTPGLPPDCFSRASRYHEARRNFRDPKRSKYASFVYVGGLAAQTLLKFLEKHLCKDSAVALEKFYRLSFDLTMLRDESAEKKAAFVSLMRELPEDGHYQDYTQEMAVRILEQYLTHEDAAALLDRAHNVKKAPTP